MTAVSRVALVTGAARGIGVGTDELAAHQPLKRSLAAEELAATIAFACSREGAVLDGSVVAADGGSAG